MTDEVDSGSSGSLVMGGAALSNTWKEGEEKGRNFAPPSCQVEACIHELG